MAHPTLHGIVPPIITPMNADESINIPELRNQIERQIAGGVHGIFCFGTKLRSARSQASWASVKPLVYSVPEV